jgi:hypothetical protein
MPAPLPGGAMAAESPLRCGAGEIRRLPALPAGGDPCSGTAGTGPAAAEMPKLQPFVTFPWSDSSNGSFAVEGPEAGIYNAARGLDPR